MEIQEESRGVVGVEDDHSRSKLFPTNLKQLHENVRLERWIVMSGLERDDVVCDEGIARHFDDADLVLPQNL